MPDFEAVVIGGGLLGCFTARNLCRWNIHSALIEAREDVCTGISRANSAIIYPGYDHKPGTLKAEMTVQANAGFDALCRELDVPFIRCGSLMVSYGMKADAVLCEKLENGKKAGVPDLKLLSGTDALKMEPSLAPGVSSALYAPTAGTVNPWELCIAACENAVKNGVSLYLNTCVSAIRQVADEYRIMTNRGIFSCRVVINCAGLNADRVQDLLSPASVHIAPDGADYLILDKATEGLPRQIIQIEPEDGGKGINAIPTVEGTLLLGPSERENSEDFAVSEKGLAFVRENAARYFPGLDQSCSIRAFASVRPNPRQKNGHSIDSFVLENPAPGFWSMIGIKTPGLTCAEELGRHAADMAAAYLGSEVNKQFDPSHESIHKARNMNRMQRDAAIKSDPDYGEVICCCEDITRAEVLEAIRRGAVTLDGIKRRTGVLMGRCQGSRCQLELLSILSRELANAKDRAIIDGAESASAGGVRNED